MLKIKTIMAMMALLVVIAPTTAAQTWPGDPWPWPDQPAVMSAYTPQLPTGCCPIGAALQTDNNLGAIAMLQFALDTPQLPTGSGPIGGSVVGQHFLECDPKLGCTIYNPGPPPVERIIRQRIFCDPKWCDPPDVPMPDVPIFRIWAPHHQNWTPLHPRL